MTPWLFDLPLRIHRALTARASLPQYELDRAHVQTKHSHIRPFVPDRGFTGDPLCPQEATPPSEMRFSGWRLAHAVKKADCLRQAPYAFAQRLGFLLEQLPTIDWRRGNLRLLPGIATAYADFTGTSLAGRIGQGLAILLMEELGHTFVAHYPRIAGKKGPDFVFERSDDRTRVLAESKGSFVAPHSQPNIKGVLADGLGQISSADPIGSKKSYAIGAFLREDGDPGEEPSLLAFVDPVVVGKENRSSSPPPDIVLRHNYAAWLDAMGLHYSASDLRSRAIRDTNEAIQLSVVNVDGVRYAVAPLQDPAPWTVDHLMPFWPRRDDRIAVAGLRLSTIEQIRAVLGKPQEMLEIDASVFGSPSDREHDRDFKGSILRDGTLLGSIPVRWLLEQAEEVRL